MIHNTFLMRISTKEILASSQYWPVDVPEENLDEFIDTREELRDDDASLADLPLNIDDDKLIGGDVVKDLVLIFVSDVGEEESTLQDHLQSATKILKRSIQNKGLEYVAENYETLIEDSITTRLKIALVGEGGTGKTTTLHLLLGDQPPLQYVPTIALNLETVENIRFGNYSLVLWDFAGQERFRNLWRFYFHGADVIFLVCDSTLRNVIISKDILKLIKRDAPKVPVFALANKQDKPNAMKPEVVQKILGVPTYPMVAIDKSRRDEMLRILMNAAAQYVGVALPDLPPQELLRFTDAATESAAEAIEEGTIREEDEDEYDEVEVIEEVYVDEDGQVIEADDEYVVIDEVVEVVEDEEPEEPVIEEMPPETERGMVEEASVTEAVSEDSMVEAESPEGVVLEDTADLSWEVETTTTESDVAEEVPVETEIPDEAPDLDEQEEWDIETVAEEAQVGEKAPIESEREEVPSAMPTITPSANIAESSEETINGTEMAKELISEALDADEIVNEEIDRASKEDLDTALEAFSSDEVVPPDDEASTEDDVDDEAIQEIYDILGSVTGDPAKPAEPETKEEEEDEEDIDEQLDELDEMFTVFDLESS